MVSLRGQKIRVSYADWDATDSSSEESDAAASAGFKKKPNEVVVGRKKSKPKERIRLNITAKSLGKEQLPFGVQRRKRGKYASAIQNPLTKKRIWLGTFVTAEEAGAAYLAKKEEFEEKLRAKRARDCARRVKKLANRESPTSVLDAGAAESKPKERIPLKMTAKSLGKERLPLGVQRRKRGKYASAIQNPLTKKRIWLGTFATAEEAGAAYLAKEEEFEEKLRVKRARDCARRGKKLANWESPTSVLEVGAADGGISGGEAAADFGVFRGVRVMDENGGLLGEFGWLDDLSILADEDGVILAR
ncbi:Ethylene-responsive transcription factor ERF117 [Striga hermonthica]|uniref:Ethylene-responsive transcription factor ERF117 n=1 Tax=Striga hermonthica TaxID=68872 RepID=A0A9N7RAF4_STRHE|nr:Ethylene-responsive transcription factor ERF117 [Striga hermonthica]